MRISAVLGILMATLRLVLVLVSLGLVTGASQSVSAQIPVSVNFELTAPGLAPNTPVYLTGSVPALGNWKPDAITMEYAGKQRWRALVIFERAMPVRYRYTLGTKEQVGADERGQPLASFTVQTQRRLTVRDTISDWTDENTIVEAAGRVTGDVRYHRYVKGDDGISRDLVVAAYDPDKIVNRDMADLILKRSETIREDEALLNIEKIGEARKKINQNVNLRLALEEFWIDF